MRLPAVLTVPGDVFVGAAMAGRRIGPRALVLTVSSSCLYLAGMALNDWADREVDGRQRPDRPIPSGRVTPEFAWRLSVGLTGAGLAVAALAGGRSALAVAVPLAGAVWLYDLVAKQTPVGPAAMAACRTLDVLLGARAGRLRQALPAGAVVGGHTLVVSGLSRREAEGSRPQLVRLALMGTATVTVAAAVVSARRARRGWRAGRAAVTVSALAAYAGVVGRAQLGAMRDPSPATVQRAVGAGVLGLMPLEASLLAATGPLPAALAVGGAWPTAIRLARRRAVT